MNPLRPLHGLLLCALPILGRAQADSSATPSAEDYFNKASRQYVKEDKLSALRVLDRGLRAHPGDPRLLKLAQELLKEDQRSQQQQDRQQQQNQQQQDSQEQQRQQEQNQQHQESSSREEERNEESGQRKESGLSRRDAERLLDELNREEQEVQERARTRMMPAHKARIEKDW